MPTRFRIQNDMFGDAIGKLSTAIADALIHLLNAFNVVNLQRNPFRCE